MTTPTKAIHHPQLGETVIVPESTADTLIAQSGWKEATKAQAAELDTTRLPVEPPEAQARPAGGGRATRKAAEPAPPASPTEPEPTVSTEK